ncbi:MAG: hypothetical protein V4772_20105 [Pseudomonadota bacterium]
MPDFQPCRVAAFGFFHHACIGLVLVILSIKKVCHAGVICAESQQRRSTLESPSGKLKACEMACFQVFFTKKIAGQRHNAHRCGDLGQLVLGGTRHGINGLHQETVHRHHSVD